MRVITTKPTTIASGSWVAYAAMVTTNEPPATAYCIAPNPSNGLTKRMRIFSARRMTSDFALTAKTVRSRSRPERSFGNVRRRGEDVEDMDFAGPYNVAFGALFPR